ncbi:hypothetical protein ACFQZ4_44025 [Catellatospora coxensis]|uniref:Uncharacterized protein n=1 Tax=Catellatospora coxensis TaxID=310354 RepID=A0A8J3KY44_9ACTN|nr:hypothetical protein [Catellatospora coxensis]GIG04195.1 hypothetical protein Cco03nite_08950 [Catellatospora coxensis]
MTPRHPTRSAGFVLLVLTALCGGVLGLVLLDNRISPTVSTWLAAVSFALFVVLCGVAALGWFWREHEVWQVLGGPEQLAARVRDRAEQQAAYAAAVHASYQARAAEEAAHRAANDPHSTEAKAGPPPRVSGS